MLRPIAAGLRYDLLIDNVDGTFARVHCKTGILKDGFITFRVRSFDARRPNGVSYRGQIECFGVFCPQIGRTYLVPMAALTALDSTARLRLRPARMGNGSASGWRRSSSCSVIPTQVVDDDQASARRATVKVGVAGPSRGASRWRRRSPSRRRRPR